MEDFLTKQHKLDLVDRECHRLKDTEEMIKYDDCDDHPENSSKTKVKKLLSDGDIQGDGLIEVDNWTEIINCLLSEENNKDERDLKDELPDEEQEQERKDNLLKEIYKLIQEGGKVDLELFEQLAKKHNVVIGK